MEADTLATRAMVAPDGSLQHKNFYEISARATRILDSVLLLGSSYDVRLNRTPPQFVMMAFERTPSSAALVPSTVAQLRAALSHSAATGSHGEELKGLLKRAATEARQNGMQAEQLLVALKDIWYSLPDLSTQPGNDAQTRLLQQLIARCIQEYYAS